MFNILICEDDANIRKLMQDYLAKEGFSVYESINGEEALSIIDKTHIDLMITDVMMPVMDGFTLTKELRDSKYEFPILMITAKETIDDKRIGFASGVDDYMVKPIDMDEMIIRVNALLRRAKITSEKMIEFSKVLLNYNDFTLRIDDDMIELPRKEFLLLFKLLSQPNRIFTRNQLMDEIWGYDTDSDERTVDVHIKRLREKVGSCDDFDIITIKGLGYKAVINGGPYEYKT